MHEHASVLVRVWLPDRSGALGLVASRIGAARAEFVADRSTLEQDGGIVAHAGDPPTAAAAGAERADHAWELLRGPEASG